MRGHPARNSYTRDPIHIRIQVEVDPPLVGYGPEWPGRLPRCWESLSTRAGVSNDWHVSAGHIRGQQSVGGQGRAYQGFAGIGMWIAELRD
eukprot:5394413-Pyramimonas_sp.AAC.1